MSKILIDRSVVEQVLEDICGAKLCEINSMSSRHEMLRLMEKSAATLRAALEQPQPLPSPVWRLVPTTMTNDMAKVDQDLRHAVPWVRWEAILAAAPLPTVKDSLTVEQEPVAHSIVAGALFDFMGWLTSRDERLVLSSTDDAAPAADAIKDFAKMRHLSLNDAQVKEWQKHLVAAPQPPVVEQEPVAEVVVSYVREVEGLYTAEVESRERLPVGAELFIHPQPRHPLTDEQINTLFQWGCGQSFRDFARAIERAHGIGGEA